MRIFRLASCAGLLMLAAASLTAGIGRSDAQVYRNTINRKFRTVSNGPQSALIVDVKNPADPAEVRSAVTRSYQAMSQSRRSSLQQLLAVMQKRRSRRGLPAESLAFCDAAIIRSNGRLAIPKPDVTRSINVLTFTLPIIGDAKPGGGTWTEADGAWTTATASSAVSLINLVYSELRDNVLGPPSWSGNVTVLNSDPRLGKVDEVLGALLVINGQNVQILFPSFATYETQFLGMAQVVAQAFHGPYRIAYDSWEIGMGRAAAVVAARDLQGAFASAGQTVNPANGYFYTSNYDLLNQPALGNNTFQPPTKSDQAFNVSTLSGMLVPRLQMSSTAWLKCIIESPSFLKNFNAAYTSALGGGTVGSDVTQLRALAKAALPAGKVEGLDFDDWYEQQYILDTSVTPGRKLYLFATSDLPDTATNGSSGAQIYGIYYDTINSSGQGDEIDRSGSANVVYWDYSLTNRLSLPSYETLTISNGFGAVAPIFSGIGGTPANIMRVAVDIPLNQEYHRLFLPAGSLGISSQLNDLVGVVVGADTGNLSINFDGGGTVTHDVVQGTFGLVAGNSIPNGFTRAHITYTPLAVAGQPAPTPVQIQKNLAFNSNFDVTQNLTLNVPGAISSLQNMFLGGLQLISLPIQPVNSDFAKVLGIDPGITLAARYRQDLSSNDKFERYPSLSLYQPGYGLFTNFPGNINATAIKGERTDQQSNLSVPLEFGWNIIGTPFNNPTNLLNVTLDLSFQYLGGDVLSLNDAITRGWVAPGIFGLIGDTYQDITATPVGLTKNILDTWKGYWIRVLVSEGVTCFYNNPAVGRSANITRAASRATAARTEAGSWRIPLMLTDGTGRSSSVTLGQSSAGSEQYVPKLDVTAPPGLGTGSLLGLSIAAKPGAAAAGITTGELTTDIRRTAATSRWEVQVAAPAANKAATLTWTDMALLPRGTRLTLIDSVTGTRQLMNTTSSYTFQPGKGELTRSIVIQAEPKAIGRLRITNVIASSSSSRGPRSVTISYDLTGAADTHIEIRMSGRVVRRIASSRAAATGTNQVLWDLKDDQGRTLAAGPYSLQITASTPEGEQTRAVVPLLVTR